MQNTVSNVLGQLIIVGLTFFSAPYITRKLGAEQYGALSLLMTYLYSFSLLNLGINTSLVKRLAELLPQKRLKEMQDFFSTSLAILVGIGALIGALVFMGAGPIAGRFFRGAGRLTPSTILALRIASAAFILQFVGQITSSIPSAAQRFEILNLVRAGSEALRIVVTVALLSLGFGLPTLMVVVLFTSLLACLAYAVASRKLIPALSLVPRFSPAHFRSLVGHSKYVVLVNLSNQLVATADTVLIGAFLPIASVAYYGIAYTLGQRLWAFAANTVSVVFPAASAFAGIEREDHIRELYLRGMKVGGLAMCFPAIALSLFSRPFLLYWLGADYADQGATVLSLLSLGFLINSFTYVPYQVLQGTHHADMAAKAAVIYSGVNLTLFGLLIPRYGIVGAAGAFLLSQMIFVPWFVGKANHLLGVSWRPLIVLLIPTFGVAVVASSVCWVCRSWIASLSTLAETVLGGFLVYMILAAVVVLDAKERAAGRFLLQRWLDLLLKRTWKVRRLWLQEVDR